MVYVDNNSIGTDVWFDNVAVQHYSGAVLEEDHYYPFGLTLSQNAAGNEQPYKLTTKELEKAFDLNYYDFGARMFDMQRGQWMGVDSMSEEFYYESPYVYVGNNPTRFVDLDGNVKLDAKGNVVYKTSGQPVQMSHPSGSTAVMQPVFIYADDGTPISAYKNVTGNAGWNTNCHGTTFGKGQVWINNDQVGKIIKGDNYKVTSKGSADQGDVLVYNYDKNTGSADHSVTVVENKNSNVTVYGQGGLEVNNHKDNANNAWPGGTQTYLRKEVTAVAGGKSTKIKPVTTFIPIVKAQPYITPANNLRVGTGSNSIR